MLWMSGGGGFEGGRAGGDVVHLQNELNSRCMAGNGRKPGGRGTKHVDVPVIGMDDDASVRVPYIPYMSGAHISNLSKPDDEAK